MSERYPISYISHSSKSKAYFTYAKVFRQAINLLLDEFIENPPLHSHSLAPVVFLLRQYIELQLKGIIAFGEGEHKVNKSHNIQSLYENAKLNVKEKYGLDGLSKPHSDVPRFIKCLSDFDIKGEAFRYPERTDGIGFGELSATMDKWLFEEITDLDKFFDIAQKVIKYLENIEGYLVYMHDQQQEKDSNA
jgi:hypothetical protein